MNLQQLYRYLSLGCAACDMDGCGGDYHFILYHLPDSGSGLRQLVRGSLLKGFSVIMALLAVAA